MSKPVIYIGADHAGYPLKEFIKEYLKNKGYLVEDQGTDSTESTDYPMYAKRVCNKVLSEHALGILICGTGTGMCMTANKFRGIRAAPCTNEYLASMARRHNFANVLCLGERVVGQGLAASIVDAFLQAEFEGGRHQRRIDQIES